MRWLENSNKFDVTVLVVHWVNEDMAEQAIFPFITPSINILSKGPAKTFIIWLLFIRSRDSSFVFKVSSWRKYYDLCKRGDLLTLLRERKVFKSYFHPIIVTLLVSLTTILAIKSFKIHAISYKRAHSRSKVPWQKDWQWTQMGLYLPCYIKRCPITAHDGGNCWEIFLLREIHNSCPFSEGKYWCHCKLLHR